MDYFESLVDGLHVNSFTLLASPNCTRQLKQCFQSEHREPVSDAANPKQQRPVQRLCRTVLHEDDNTSGLFMGLWHTEIRREHESHAIQPTAKHRL